MENKKIKEIKNKVKKFLGIKKLPVFEIKIDQSLTERTAFNKKVGDKYIVTISPDNYSGLKHELIHLALKRFSYSALKNNLPVPKKYKDDNKETKFMEYLTIVLEIKMGDPEKVKENLDNYQKYGFLKIKNFYKVVTQKFKNRSLNQKLINEFLTS